MRVRLVSSLVTFSTAETAGGERRRPACDCGQALLPPKAEKGTLFFYRLQERGTRKGNFGRDQPIGAATRNRGG
ncbi:MAG TPA: hypothetical protein P5057_09380, partial [Acidobacteriota bacterium]|nr:hypothetical protein [Acidobacteriota bacterium]